MPSGVGQGRRFFVSGLSAKRMQRVVAAEQRLTEDFVTILVESGGQAGQRSGLIERVDGSQPQPVMNDMILRHIRAALLQRHRSCPRPAHQLQLAHLRQQTLTVRLHALLSTAGAGAAAQCGSKAGAAAAERLQTEQAVTEALFVSKALQHLQRRPPVGEQTIEMLLVREINLAGIDNLRPVVRKQPGAELLVTP